MSTQSALRRCEEKQFFFHYSTAANINKCFNQIKVPILLYTCTTLFLSIHLIKEPCYNILIP